MFHIVVLDSDRIPPLYSVEYTPREGLPVFPEEIMQRNSVVNRIRQALEKRRERVEVARATRERKRRESHILRMEREEERRRSIRRSLRNLTEGEREAMMQFGLWDLDELCFSDIPEEITITIQLDETNMNDKIKDDIKNDDCDDQSEGSQHTWPTLSTSACETGKIDEKAGRRTSNTI